MSKNWYSNTKLSRKEHILYYIIWSVIYFLSLMPFWLMYRVSEFFYLISYYVVRYRRDIVKKNLDRSFPEKTEQERREIAKKFYHSLCDNVVEAQKLANPFCKSIVGKRVEYVGMDKIFDCVKHGRSVAVYMGHYGNWEWITTLGLHLNEDCPGVQVYHVQESVVMDKIMLKLRGRMHTKSIAMADILRGIIKLQHEGKHPVVGFISDQSPIIYNVPYWADFLNHPETPFISGTSRLARKLNMSCAYFDVSKVSRGHYRVEVKIIAEDPSTMSEDEITESYVRMLEQTIRRQPELWLWSHNRWKRRKEEYNIKDDKKA